MEDWNSNMDKYVGHISSSGYDSIYLREKGVINNFLNFLGNTGNATILDLGCGDGWLSRNIGNENLHECDIKEPTDLVNRPNFIVGDATNIPFSNGRFNIVVGSLLLMWLKDLDIVAEEIYRVTAPNGYFITCLTSPHFYRTVDIDNNGEVKIVRSLAQNFVLNDLYIGGKVGPFTYYYRPLSEYINTFIKKGWVIEFVYDWFIDMDDYKQSLPSNTIFTINRTDKVPLYTFIKYRKS